MEGEILHSNQNPIQDLSTIIVSTEEDYSEIVTKALFRPLININPFKRNTGSFIRILSNAPKLLKGRGKAMSTEEKGKIIFDALMGPEFRLNRFTPEEARKLFKFEGGQLPRSGSVYFEHPFEDKKYLNPSTFNVSLAREKVFIFNQLSGFLGAKKIILYSGVVRSKKWNGKAKLPLPDVAAELGLSARFDTGSMERAQTYAEFDRPNKPPHVPEHLALWAKSDPLFQSMVQSRLGSRLRKQKVMLELKEYTGFSASLIGKYSNIGFDVGGKCHELIHSVWQCEIEYWPVG